MKTKTMYAIMITTDKGTGKVLSYGGLINFQHYCSRLIYFAQHHYNIDNQKDFVQYFYSWFYNPEWSIDEQLCHDTLPLAKAPWLDLKLYDAMPSNLIVGAKENIYLAKIKTTLQNDADYQILAIIKPQTIWQKRFTFPEWRKIELDYFDPNLLSLTWTAKQSLNTYSPFAKHEGRKPHYRKSTNNKHHYVHLTKHERNKANRIKNYYGLSCLPKHTQTRHYEFDIRDVGGRAYRNGCESWKNHKHAHQYDHRLGRAIDYQKYQPKNLIFGN